MTKRKMTGKTVEDFTPRTSKPEPKLTRLGYLASISATAVGFVVELIIAYFVYPWLPSRIPAYWIGHLVSGESVPSWVVWLVFPAGQIILLLVALHGRKVKDGRHVMESGKAWTILLIALLFVVLQASAYHLPRR